jgi:hypothetical protein
MGLGTNAHYSDSSYITEFVFDTLAGSRVDEGFSLVQISGHPRSWLRYLTCRSATEIDPVRQLQPTFSNSSERKRGSKTRLERVSQAFRYPYAPEFSLVLLNPPSASDL